jgi:hypothetical protein
MKSIRILFIVVILVPLSGIAQKAWIIPEKFNPDDSITIYVDVSKTDCNRLMDTQDDIYLWAWEPADPVLGNGEWTNSSETNKMTRSADDPNIYYYKMVATEFFSLSNTKDIYDIGFSFLAKKKDGTGLGGGGCDEDKTEDLHVDVEPIPGCNTKYCQLPGVVFEDDYFTFIYNPTKEDKPTMAETVVGSDNFAMFLRAFLVDGSVRTIASYGEIINHPELWLEKDPNDGNYKNTFVPRLMFDLQEGEAIDYLQIQTVNKNYSGPDDVSDDRIRVDIGCN